MYDDLGDLGRHHLTCADIKRYSLPAPIVYVELHGDEGLRSAIRGDLIFLTIGTLMLSLPLALCILSADDTATNLLGSHWAEGLIYLHDLVAK